MSSSPAAHALPAELLLTVFEAILILNDSATTYKTLLAAAQVCRRWGSAASRVLLSHVEITKRADALSLIQLFDRFPHGDHGPFIETLVVGLGSAQDSHTLIDDALFLQLLSYPSASRIRKLVVLHQNALGCITQLPPLPCLTDVTLSAAGGAPASLSETTLIQALPSQVRFLTLPGAERTRFVGPIASCAAPAFKLFGLTVQDYPTPSSKWLLGESDSGLQCLDVVYMGRLDQCAENHPRLRSLRIMGRVSNSSSSYAAFQCLERLELRDLSAKPDVIDTLPSSLQYFRFWSTELAGKLADSLERKQLPNLHTVVWDHFSPKGGAHAVAMEAAARRLREACQQNGVELRMYERKDGGKRASMGKDLAYESALRYSCFCVANESHPVPSSSSSSSASSLPTRLPVRVLSHMHSAGLPLAPHFKSISPFMNSIPGMWSPVWEESFDGHSQWLEDTLPRLEQARKMSITASAPLVACSTSVVGAGRAMWIPKRNVF